MAPIYFNENAPYPAQWLRNLIAARLLPAGDVDERSIADVAPDDLRPYRHCHFFAGIGGWALAARSIRWPDERELWTGSCPCQPFSLIGERRGLADARHLWPHLFRLIAARRPAVWMGEQVASAAGAHWLDGVLADLEDIGYAGRAVVVGACAVDAPHRRQRLWLAAEPAGALDDAERSGLERHSGHDLPAPGRTEPARSTPAPGGVSPWRDAVWLRDRFGRARRAQPGVPLLVDGVSSRVGRLRAYGNAVVPPLAAEIMAAYLECRP